MRECLYYSCPIDGTVLLQKDRVYIKAYCDAGCGKLLIYLPACDVDTPKVCYDCTEWVENPLGSA